MSTLNVIRMMAEVSINMLFGQVSWSSGEGGSCISVYRIIYYYYAALQSGCSQFTECGRCVLLMTSTGTQKTWLYCSFMFFSRDCHPNALVSACPSSVANLAAARGKGSS